jgi:hypothetical protein
MRINGPLSQNSENIMAIGTLYSSNAFVGATFAPKIFGELLQSFTVQIRLDSDI